jgi:hypothetical protein
MKSEHKRPGNTPVEQQERSPGEVEETRHADLAITGPGAADFQTASGGLDQPGSATTKGMAQTRGESPLDDAKRLAPRLGPDDESMPGERHPNEDKLTGSQTGTIGGGGLKGEEP